jgi:hypothetical protein
MAMRSVSDSHLIGRYERGGEFRGGLGPKRSHPCSGKRDDRSGMAILNGDHFSASAMQRLYDIMAMELLAAEAQYDLGTFRHWEQFQAEMRLVEFSDD